MKVFFSIAAIFFFVAVVASLQCYVCKSFYDGEECSSSEKIKMSNRFLLNCNEVANESKPYSYCRKMVHDIPIPEGGVETRVVRECGYLNTSSMNSCQKIGMNNVGQQIMCSCQEDGCNHSSQMKPQLACVFLFLLSIFYTSLL